MKNPPSPRRSSSRPTKKPTRFGVVANPDLSNLRPGVSYCNSKRKASARDEMQGCFPGLHDVGYAACDDFTKRGEEVYHTVLKPAGWKHVKSSLLYSPFSYVAHPFSLRTATEGVTMFQSFVAIAEQLERDGGDVNAILERAKQAGAIIPAPEAVLKNNDDSEKSAQENDHQSEGMNNNHQLAGTNNHALVTPINQGRQRQQQHKRELSNGEAPAVVPKDPPPLAASPVKQDPNNNHQSAGTNTRALVSPTNHGRQQQKQQQEFFNGEAPSVVPQDPPPAAISDKQDPVRAQVIAWLQEKLGDVHSTIRDQYADLMMQYGLDSAILLDKAVDQEDQKHVLENVIKMKPYHIAILTGNV